MRTPSCPNPAAASTPPKTPPARVGGDVASAPGSLRRRSAATVAAPALLAPALAALALVAGCASTTAVREAPDCRVPVAAAAVATPPAPSCDDPRLTAYDALLVIAPHPDDEVLGFAGLIDRYLEQGKPVEVVVTTDGDAYCDACRFWKSGSVTGPTCGAADLSDFATPEVDSFAEVRRRESRTALEHLGAGAPTFLGYPDTGLAAAWTHVAEGHPDRPLSRSDFSACSDCETCDGGYGEGPATDLSAATLTATLRELLEGTPRNALVATTHWLDGHGDHAALGRFVRSIDAQLAAPRAIAFAVIHAHTPKDTPHQDCWYPAPRARLCPCALEECARRDPSWSSELRRHRFRPEWPASLPDDADYGEEVQLCLREELYRGEAAAKLAAVESYASQLGFAVRQGSLPPALGGLVDCNGYLLSFVRSTEAFVLLEPGEAAGR